MSFVVFVCLGLLGVFVTFIYLLVALNDIGVDW